MNYFTTGIATAPIAAVRIHLPAAWDHCEAFLKELHNENAEVSASYRTLATCVQQAYSDGSISANDTGKIIRAIQFAANQHQNQTRKNVEKTPYIIHPMGVASHLMTTGNVRDTDIIIAGLLHDTVEDTGASLEEISREFGVAVAEYVREVTDDKSLPKAERKRLQIVNAPHKSPGAAMVKLADKHYNLSDMLVNPLIGEDGNPWPQERTDAYFSWAKQVVNALPPVNPALKQAVDDVLKAH